MTRTALRKAQHNLFDAGPAACMAPQPRPAAVNGAFLHPCSEPGCGAWGAFGVGVFGVGVFAGVPGAWWCGEHRP